MTAFVHEGRRSFVVLFAVLAMIAALLAIPATPVNAVTTAACPATVPSAGFTDLAGFSADVVDGANCLAFYGITKGTSATTYGPAANVSRWQMALFLTRQAVDHGVTLPSGADQGFTDLTGLSAEAVTAINQLAQLNITKGTSATTFDPNGNVGRWQMALFITRLVTGAGITLPSGADQGFTDISGLSAEAQLAINQAAQLAISKGTTATTFDPTGLVTRAQMALFLTRTLQAGGVVPAGTGNIVTAAPVGLKISYADAATGKAASVTLKASGETYMVDGAAATQAAFVLQVSIGDLLSISGTAFALTNKVAADYTSGVIDVVVAGSFSIVEPITGAVLNGTPTTGGLYQLYTVDGASVSEAGFDLDANAGDTVTITGKGTVTDIQTVALTNQTLSGTADWDGVALSGVFSVAKFADMFTAATGDSITIDGTVDTLLNFQTELTDGDAITYAKKGGKQTIVLTNAAASPVSGKVLTFATPSASVDVSGVSTAINYATANLIVDGVLSSIADFDGDLSIGDTLVYQAADTASSTTETATLTNATLSGSPAAARVLTTLTLEFATSGAPTAAIDYTSTAPALTDLTGTAVKYTVNSSTTATVAVFEAAYDSVVAGVFDGTVTLTKSGNDLIWTITTS